MDMELIYTDISDLSPEENDIERISRGIPGYFRKKVEDSKHIERKMESLAGGLLLSYMLSLHGFDPEKACIREASGGKPVFEDPEIFNFNISHSEGLVLLAAFDDEIGCDIQKIKGDGRAVSERFFTPEEDNALKSAPQSLRDELFTRLWARKESYIKATGEGMRRDLRTFSVLKDNMDDGYSLLDITVAGYAAAVCFRCKDNVVTQIESTPYLRFIPFQNLADVI